MSKRSQKELAELVGELRKDADHLNCRLYSGLGYTAHIEGYCPRCIKLAVASKLESVIGTEKGKV